MPEGIQDYMFRRVNGSLADRLQRRVRRRTIAVAAVLAAGAIAAALAADAGRLAWLVAAALPFWLAAFLLNLSLRGIFELADDRLDEHQVAVRDRAYKTAYGFTLVFLVVIATVATALAPDRTGLFSIAVFAFLTSALAPRLVAAWTLDDGDDGE